MAPNLAELAENTAIHLLPRPTFETVIRDDLVYVAGIRAATVHRVRAANVDWVRTESRQRGHENVEWWVGWSAPPEVAGQLLAQGLVPDDTPVLTGMTCTIEPAAVPDVEVRRVETVEDYTAALEIDWQVWGHGEEERAKRRQVELGRFDELYAGGTVHHYAAFLDGQRVGFGRGIDIDAGVALMGGAVLPEARGRGVYRALVRARWDHAAARGTPLLVVQAGDMSAPVDGLGFVRHGEIRLFADRL
jgi:GNAT superfamily N-acetyltransferase